MSKNLNVFLKIYAMSYSKFIAFDYLLNKQNLFAGGGFYCEACLLIIRMYIGRENKSKYTLY